MKRFDPMFWFGVSFLTLLVLVAVFGPMGSAGHNAIVADPYLGPSAQHWMGTESSDGTFSNGSPTAPGFR